MQNQSNPIFSKKKKVTPKMATLTLVNLAMLTALGVICSMPAPYGLTFRVGNDLKFTFSFLVVALAARKYGVVGSTLVAFMSDFIQTIVAGYGFPYWMISLSATLTGVIFGLLMHKNINILRIILAVLFQGIVCSLIITTAALMRLYGIPLFPLFWWRLLQTVIMSGVEIAVLYFLFIKSNVLYKIKFLNRE